MSFLLWFAFLIVYFLPFFCACGKGHSAKIAFFFANVIFGWTAVGWFVLLFVAANTKPPVIQLVAAKQAIPIEPEAVVIPLPPIPQITGEAFNFTSQKWEPTYGVKK